MKESEIEQYTSQLEELLIKLLEEFALEYFEAYDQWPESDIPEDIGNPFKN